MTRVIDGQHYYLSLTDTAGQEEYRGLWAASNLRSDAFLLVYDITSPSSLANLEYFQQMIDMECDHRQDVGGVPPVKLVAGNKCDLRHQRRVSSKEGMEWARDRGCGFMETSAREMVNVEETFARECFGLDPSKRDTELYEPCRTYSHIELLFAKMLIYPQHLVLVRRVIQNRQAHASRFPPKQQRKAKTNIQGSTNKNMATANIISPLYPPLRTEPSRPFGEKSSFHSTNRLNNSSFDTSEKSLEGHGGTKKKSFWARLKCW